MTFTYPGAKSSVKSCNIITSKPLGLGRIKQGRYAADRQWIADLSLDYITVRTMTKPQEVEKEKVTTTSFARLLMKANRGVMPSTSTLSQWKSMVPEIKKVLMRASSSGAFNPSASSSASLSSGTRYGSNDKTTSGSLGGKTGNKGKVVGNSSSGKNSGTGVASGPNRGSGAMPGSSAKSQAAEILRRWKTCGLTDNEVMTLLNGLENNEKVYNTSTYTVTEDVAYEVRDTINLLYLPLSCDDASWNGGFERNNNSGTFQYELPFTTWKLIGYKDKVLQSIRSYSRYPDGSIGMLKSGNEYMIQKDPYMYLSWLANYAMVGGWKAQLKKYNIGVSTTESLVSFGSGGINGGRYGQASEDRVTEGAKELLDVFVYSPEPTYFPVRELDKVEEDVALLGNSRMRGINPWSYESSDRYTRMVAETVQNILDVYSVAYRVSSGLENEMKIVDNHFGRYKTEKGKLKNFVSDYLEECNGLYQKYDPSGSTKGVSSSALAGGNSYARAFVPYYQMALTSRYLDPNDLFEFEGQQKISKGRFHKVAHEIVWGKLSGVIPSSHTPFLSGKARQNVGKLNVQVYRTNCYDLNSGEYAVNPELYDMSDGILAPYTAPVINITLEDLDDQNAKGYEPTRLSEIFYFPGDQRPTMASSGNSNGNINTGGKNTGDKNTNTPVGSHSKSSTDLKMNNAKPVSQFIKDMKMEQTIENIKNGNIRIDVGNGNSSKKEANSTPELPSTLIKVGTITDNDIKKAETERQTRVTGPINTEISKADTTSTAASSTPIRKAEPLSSTKATTSGVQKATGTTSTGSKQKNSTGTQLKQSIRTTATGTKQKSTVRTRRTRR